MLIALGVFSSKYFHKCGVESQGPHYNNRFKIILALLGINTGIMLHSTSVNFYLCMNIILAIMHFL